MKGLILKEFYNLKSFQRQYFFIVLFMAAWIIFFKNVSFVTTYLMVLCGSVVMNTMNMDESACFNRLALTMPISTGAMILAKYLFSAIIFVMGTMASLLVNQIGEGILKDVELSGRSFAPMEWQAVLLVSLAFALTYAIVLPVSLRYGAEKGRYMYLAAMLLMAGIILGSVKVGSQIGLGRGLERLGTFLLCSPFLLVAGTALLYLGVMAISYGVCLRMVKKKGW